MNAVDQPIDIVYPWLDGSDPLLPQKLATAMAGREGTLHHNGIGPFRFRGGGDLKYSLRSILKFAPFIRNIYLVTDGHRPKWLRDHPRVRIVDHKDIFDTAIAPERTFSSNAISCHIHRIPGLSEAFLFANDDFFFVAPTSSADFVFPSGGLRIDFNEGLMLARGFNADPYFASCLNSARLARKRFGWSFFPRFKSSLRFPMDLVRGRYAPYNYPSHQIKVVSKAIASEIESMFPDEYNQTAGGVFREPRDISIETLWAYVSVRTGRGVPNFFEEGRDFVFVTSNMGTEEILEKTAVVEGSGEGRPKLMCLNDGPCDNVSKWIVLVQDLLERLYPIAAPWEG